MKKHLLGLAAISLLLGVTSCGQETVETVNDGKNAIEFKTALGKQAKSRAAEVGIGDLQKDGITLIVNSYYKDKTNAFETFNLTYNSGTSAWGYGTEINQPGVPLRYYSVHSTLSGTVTDGAATTSSYSFKYAVQAVNEDLLVATVGPTTDTQIDLEYQHALSQINFSVQGILGVKITISNLKINGVKDGGTYTFGTGDGTKWSNLTSSGTVSYTYTPISIPTDGSATTVISLGSGSTTDKNALMLMPQVFSADTDGTLSFDFSLDTGESSPKTGSITANLCDFDTKAWIDGKRYRYTIDFTSYLIGGPIKFGVTVASWVDDNHNTVAETLHVAKATLLSIEDAIARHREANTATPALATFPIAVAEDLTTEITIASITGFNPEDEIRIEFPDDTSVENLKCSDTGWTRTTSDRVVILKKN